MHNLVLEQLEFHLQAVTGKANTKLKEANLNESFQIQEAAKYLSQCAVQSLSLLPPRGCKKISNIP